MKALTANYSQNKNGKLLDTDITDQHGFFLVIRENPRPISSFVYSGTTLLHVRDVGFRIRFARVILFRR